MRGLRLSRAFLVTFACVVALAGSLANPANATVTVLQWPAGKLTVQGLGYGHGAGLSQYGAELRADDHWSHGDILDFYYPGTASAPSPVGTVRVLITADKDVDTVVRPQTGLRFRDLGTTTAATLLPTGLGARLWKLHPNTTYHRLQLSWFNGSWHKYRLLAGLGQFSATAPMTLVLPGGVQRHYRGALRNVYTAQPAGQRTVEVVGLDSYLRGVVPREMPPYWRPEALAAQAVAARTYAAHQALERSSRTWQLCDTTACQVYGGADAEDSRTNAAVTATANQVLLYGGKPAFTKFSSSNGGWSVGGGTTYPYLQARADDYDPYVWQGSSNYAWTRWSPWAVTKDTLDLQKAHPEIGTLQSVAIVSTDGNGTWGGRVLTLRLSGTRNGAPTMVDLPGTEVRRIWGLKSTWFHFVAG